MAGEERKEISMLDVFRFEEGSDSELASKITNGSEIPLIEDQEENSEEESEENTTEEDESGDEVDEEAETTEEETDDSQESDNVDDSDDEGVYSTLANILIDKGVLIPKEDKEYLESEDGVLEIVEDTVEFKFQEHINSLEEIEIREGVTFKDFAEYIKDGGDPREFMDQVTKVDYRQVLVEGDDEESIETQKLVIRDRLLLDEMSEEEIEETISQYEESNMLQKQAKLSLKTLVKKQDEEYTRMLEAQEESKAARLEEIKQQEKQLKDAVSNLKKVGNFELTEKEQDNYLKWLTVPVKKINGVLYTQCQLDNLDVNKRLEIGYIQFKGGIEGLEKKITGKANLKLKEKISRLTKEDKNISRSTESYDDEVTSTNKPAKGKFKLPYDWM